MILMMIKGLVLDIQSKSPILILKEIDGARILPIWIGEEEAFSISLALNEVKSARPLTHDLLAVIITKLNTELLKLIIDRLEDNTYYSFLILSQGNDIIKVDCRPSDGIAIALRLKKPIFTNESLLDSAGVNFNDADNDEQQIERIKNKFQHIEPENFGELII